MKRIRFFVRGFLTAAAALVLLNGGHLSDGALDCALALVCVAVVLKTGCISWNQRYAATMPSTSTRRPMVYVNKDWLRLACSVEPIKLRTQMG
jgi:hypothetical protein